MPKNPLKTFGRRKSSSNILDAHLASNEPKLSQEPESTGFRVLDRPPKNAAPPTNGPQAPRVGSRRPFNSSLSHLRLGKSADDLGTFTNRGSGGTTLSGSSYNYDSSSARHSSSSTLPSSVDPERDADDEDLFPRKVKSQPMNKTALDAPLPPPPSFTARATRAFSFGSKSSRHEPEKIPPVPPIPHLQNQHLQREAQLNDDLASRDRATTVSSYASTAIPAPGNANSSGLQIAGLSSSFGDDFGSMFAGLGKDSPQIEAQNRDLFPDNSHRTELEPMFPARALSRTGRTPSPNPALIRRQTGSPYSFEANDSDGLISHSASQSPALESAPAPPSHGSSLAKTFMGSKTQYAPIPEQYSPGVDTPFESLSATPNGQFSMQQTSLKTPNNDTDSLFAGSSNATPKAIRTADVSQPEDSLFDLAASARRAVHSVQFAASTKPQKRMTTAEFERLRIGDVAQERASEDDAVPEDDDDDQDEAERARELTRQRRKQEANMAVYRQQMKKVTGGGPSDLPSTRPTYDRAPSSNPSAMGIHFGGLNGTPPPESIRGKVGGGGGDDDDDDVPLGILQAHGFPSASRPPVRHDEGDSYGQRRASVAGSVYGGIGNNHNGGGGGRALPPFARKLPVDPYYGAGIVNQSNRESLAFSQSAAQPPVMGHPGGLVGVIAGEERARAARRGSPNPTTGAYEQPLPLPSNMPSQQPNASRTMSMTNLSPQMPFGAGPMPGMPMMPNGPGMPPMLAMPGMPQFPMNMPQEQMQQFMQMQMQLMQNMLAIQQQTLGQGPQTPMSTVSQDYLGVPGTTQRPMSSMSSYGRPTSQALPSFDFSSQRPASAVAGGYTPSVFGMNGGGPGPGYTPSIAPSERSNVGMPSRYRPVSMMPVENPRTRTQSMTSNATLQAFNNRASMNAFPVPEPPLHSSNGRPMSTIRVIDKPRGTPATRQPTRARANDDNSDEEESGWAEMAKKRTEKKWSWRKKNEDPKRKEQAALQELYQGLES